MTDDREELERIQRVWAVYMAAVGSTLILEDVVAHSGEIAKVVGTVLPVVVALGTGSMAPVIDGGDRLVHDAGMGDVERGDVIVFAPDGDNSSTPVGHRAMFHVEAGENWFERANKSFVGNASSCEELMNCPAPHSGWITKGDARGTYDQAAGLTDPVRGGWIHGEVVVIVDPDGWDVRVI